jgi:gluconate 2-dehydrogenase gamma chain
MRQSKVGRRGFILGVGVAGAAAPVMAQPAAPAPTPASAPPAPAGYLFLNPAEAAFVEALVSHMIPADDLTPDGVDLGLAIYIDRALASGWGKGDRLYLKGPWAAGTPNQGYQLGLTPAALYRAGIAASNVYCRATFGRTFDRMSAADRETFLLALARGQVKFASGLPSQPFFDVVYQTVMEGMFADPIYGGNRGKAGWKMIGFPGVAANNARNAQNFYDGRRFPAEPVSISDMS